MITSQKLKITHETSNQGSFENNIHNQDTIKAIAKAYLSIRKCSIQQNVYHIFPELKLRRIFLIVFVINTNLPQEGVQV